MQNISSKNQSTNRLIRLRQKFELGIDRAGILAGLQSEINTAKNRAVRGWLIHFKSTLEAMAAREVK